MLLDFHGRVITPFRFDGDIGPGIVSGRDWGIAGMILRVDLRLLLPIVVVSHVPMNQPAFLVEVFVRLLRDLAVFILFLLVSRF